MHRGLKSGFSLVFSGGGALGYAHVGVLRYFREQGMAPSEVLGTSMGAIVAAAWAIGLSEAALFGYIQRFAAVAHWARPSLKRPALLNTDRLATIFADLFGDRRMADVRTPLKIVATDFGDGSIRVFDAGDHVLIRDAVRCSMSIPVIFPPVELMGRFYVDGYISANLPVAQVSNHRQPIVAVDVMSERALPPYRPGGYSLFEHPGAIIDTYERSFYLLVQNQSRAALKKFPGVILIKPLLTGFKSFHFRKFRPIIAAGYREAVNVFS